MKMVSESMKNLTSEDLKNVAEQLKHARTEDMLEVGSKMAKAHKEIAAIHAHTDEEITYKLNEAQMLKNQGNDLHNQGKFHDAAQKYLFAKKDLKDIPLSQSVTLQLTCSLNLMSCYLKTGQYDECIKEGSEVLVYDGENVKALYRRGQAYKELGLLDDAVSDFSKAHEVSPDDETISEVLREMNERLKKGGGNLQSSKRLVIEEITEKIQTVPLETLKSSSTEYSVRRPQETTELFGTCSKFSFGSLATETECLQSFKDNPEAIRLFHNFISNVDPETLASLSSENSGTVSPEMFNIASNVISNMSPQELQKILQVASSFQGSNPYFLEGDSEMRIKNSNSGPLPPDVSPDVPKTSADMTSKMSPYELQKIFQLASSLKERDSVITAMTMTNKRPISDKTLTVSVPFGVSSVNRNHDVGESRSCKLLSDFEMDPFPPNFPPSTCDMQDQMRNQLKDPAMQQMFTSIIKNMSPEMMSTMSEQFGMKLSREDAEKAQQVMSSLSPEDLDRMMQWENNIQRGVESAKKTKSWLLGRPGMILAICMLILAVILHRLGFIGS